MYVNIRVSNHNASVVKPGQCLIVPYFLNAMAKLDASVVLCKGSEICANAEITIRCASGD